MAILDTFGMAQIKSDLERDEGRLDYVYDDATGRQVHAPKGNLTFGIGHNFNSSGGAPDELINWLFEYDLQNIVLVKMDANISWWRQLPQEIQRVLINMCFNLGWSKLATFVTFLDAVRRHDFVSAADDLRNTLWARQLPARANRLIGTIRASGQNA